MATTSVRVAGGELLDALSLNTVLGDIVLTGAAFDATSEEVVLVFRSDDDRELRFRAKYEPDEFGYPYLDDFMPLP